MGVKALFNHGARAFPERLCLDDGKQRLSYAEVYQQSRQTAAALRASGVLVGAKCALLSPNCAAAMVSILSIYQADAVFVPLNSGLPAADHVLTVQQLAVSVLFFHSRYAAAASHLLEKGDIALALCIDTDTGIGLPLDHWRASFSQAPLVDGKREPGDVIAIYPTGGSTGRPKRVMLTRLAWETMVASFLTSTPSSGLPVYLMTPPITHAAGTYAMMLMASGASIILQDGFDPATVVKAIEDHRVTHLFLPPTAIYKLLTLPDIRAHDYGSLQAFIYTAAPMSVDKLRDCISIFGPVMVQYWGQTEAPCFLTCLRAQDHVVDDPALAGRLASCGRETMFVEVAVMSDDGGLLPVGERGELVVRGNLVMAGYYDNPEATEEAFRFGWHHTGDVGFKDQDGFVYIVGRKSDMIISGGFNIYPADIEQVLWGHPDIEECAVIGVLDEFWGESVLAVVQLKQGRSISAEALMVYCKAHLGSMRTPKFIELRDDIPRNAIGKVDKVRLREQVKARQH